jgi:hypothetical protein
MKAFGACQRRGAVRGIVQVSESIQSGFLGPITLALQQWDANGDLVRGSQFEIVFERDEAARVGYELARAARMQWCARLGERAAGRGVGCGGRRGVAGARPGYGVPGRAVVVLYD